MVPRRDARQALAAAGVCDGYFFQLEAIAEDWIQYRTLRPIGARTVRMESGYEPDGPYEII